MSRHIAILSAIAAVAAAAAPPQPPPIDLPGVDAELLAGFKAVHVAIAEKDQRRGYVDWSTRRIVAVGRAPQQGRDAAAPLRARRAAEVIALRNVLAASLGVRIGVNGRIRTLRRGEVVLRGHLQGFKIARTYSRRIGAKTYWYAEVHVPMFGVRNVAGRLFDEQLLAHRLLVRRRTRARWAPAAAADALGGEVLIIDARGLGFAPSMYPLVVTSARQVLIDMETVPRDVAIARGLCAYATTDVKFEKLQSLRPPAPGAPGRVTSVSPQRPPHKPPPSPLAAGPGAPRRGVRAVAWAQPLLAAADADTRPASRPTTQPRPRRRRFVIRARQAEGREKSVLVVSDKDALKLLADPKAAGLVRNGRVLVVVDAAAAGMEGRGPSRAGPVAVAAAGR